MDSGPKKLWNKKTTVRLKSGYLTVNNKTIYTLMVNICFIRISNKHKIECRLPIPPSCGSFCDYKIRKYQVD